MGKFEKLVVLSVFLAVGVVLAVALNRGKAQLESSGPLRGAEEVLGGTGKPASAPRSESARPNSTPRPESVRPDEGTSLLLNAGAERPAPRVTEAPVKLGVEPVSDKNARILASDAGLRPSFLEEYMVYTVAAGDTWASLAQRFYQDGRYARNLQQANDGLSQLAPASNILVPVFDFIEMDAGLQPGSASSTPVATLPETSLPGPTSESAPRVTTPAGRPVAGAPEGTGQVYVVQAGDTLSDLSKAVFGTATRWQELLDANRDVLQKPENLRVGMKLKIPAGGTMPVAAAREASAPKTATKPAGEKAAPKKSKVN